MNLERLSDEQLDAVINKLGARLKAARHEAWMRERDARDARNDDPTDGNWIETGIARAERRRRLAA